MKTIEQVDKFSNENFQKTFDVNRVNFATMLFILNKQYEEAHKKGGRSPKVRCSTNFAFSSLIIVTKDSICLPKEHFSNKNRK